MEPSTGTSERTSFAFGRFAWMRAREPLSAGPTRTSRRTTLGRAISDIRTALGEGPKDQHYVVTVARRGYRFAAHVTTVASSAAPIDGLHDAACA